MINEQLIQRILEKRPEDIPVETWLSQELVRIDKISNQIRIWKNKKDQYRTELHARLQEMDGHISEFQQICPHYDVETTSAQYMGSTETCTICGKELS